MKNEEFRKDLEQLLKSKMDELAESVDCFDKISERAFPADNKDFSESGFTVTDLETVSSDTKKRHIVRWTALAGAAAAAIFLLPKTGIPQRALMKLGGNSSKCSYEAILGEIESQTSDGSYYIMDIPLEYYIENDILVTPLMSCPFEETDRDDANVRLYIKQIDGWDTNQVYAVEYLGTYSESNIVAAAKSKYTFTAEEIARKLPDLADTQALADTSAYQSFFGGDEGVLTDAWGNAVSLASFEYDSVVKDESGIRKLKTEIIYGTRSEFGKEPENFYDITTHISSDEPAIPEADKMWETSVYFNGNSAFPEKSGSAYTRETLFTEKISDAFDYAAMPVSEDWLPPLGMNIGLRGTILQNLISTVTCPANLSAAINLKLYFSIDTMLAYDNATVELVDCSGTAPEPVHEYSIYEINENMFDAESMTPEMEAELREKAMREEAEWQMRQIEEQMKENEIKAEEAYQEMNKTIDNQ